MRYDLFQQRKSIHIKLTKESHAALREKLFRYGITMQDIFQDFADMMLTDERRSLAVIEKIVAKKLSKEMKRAREIQPMGEFDSDTLYNLLEREESSDEDEEKT